MSIRRSFDDVGLRAAAALLGSRLLLLLALTTLFMFALATLPGVPYQIRALFGPSPSWGQALLFSSLALFALTPPALFGLQLIRLPSNRAWLFPLGLILHGSLAFLGVRYATPIASVHALVGVPVWGVAEELERWWRFLALFLLLSVPLAGGTALLYGLTRSYAPRRLLWWLVFAIPLLTLSRQVVVGAGTGEGFPELLRGGGAPLPWAVLALWLATLSFTASLLAERAAGVLDRSLPAIFAVLLFLPLSYVLLIVVLSPSVGLPGSDLTALAFLLTPVQGRYGLAGVDLFLRYTASYFGAVLLLALAQYPLWLIYSTRRFAVRVPPVPPSGASSVWP